MAVKFSNNAVTSLTDSPSAGATFFNVASASAFPTLASGDWTYVSLTSEVVKVTAISGTTFTCDATSNAHASGESVELRMTAELLNDFAEDTESLPIGGGTMTGDVSLGDNVKAQFGASDDLNIFHDGNNSYIVDSGTGGLRIRGSSFVAIQGTNGENGVIVNENGATDLHYNSAKKLTTTSTGVDVTGSVTCDGFTSTGIDDNATAELLSLNADGNTQFGASVPVDTLRYLDLYNTSTGSSAGALFRMVTSNAAGTGNTTTNIIKYKNSGFLINNNDTASSNFTAFGVAGAERMRIDSAGNVGIGTSSIPTGVRTKIKGLAEATNLATSATSAALFIEPYSGSSWGLGIGSVTGQKQYIQAVYAAGDGTKELLLQPFGGNVGIGTTTPTAQLHTTEFKTDKWIPELRKVTITGGFQSGCAPNTWYNITNIANWSGYLGGYSGENKGVHFEIFWTSGSTAKGYNHSVVGWLPPRSSNTYSSYSNASFVTHNSGSTMTSGVPVTVHHHTSATAAHDIRVRTFNDGADYDPLYLQIYANTSPNSGNATITLWRA